MKLRRALKIIKVQTFHVFVYSDAETCAVSDDPEQFDVIRDVYGQIPMNLKYADCHVDSVIPTGSNECNLRVIKNWKRKKKKSRISDLELQLEEIRRLLVFSNEKNVSQAEEVSRPEQDIYVTRSHGR